MKYFWLSLILSSLSFPLWACPNCHPLDVAGRGTNYLIILGVFILVTYIPFYLLFSAAKKYDPKNHSLD